MKWMSTPSMRVMNCAKRFEVAPRVPASRSHPPSSGTAPACRPAAYPATNRPPAPCRASVWTAGGASGRPAVVGGIDAESIDGVVHRRSLDPTQRARGDASLVQPSLGGKARAPATGSTRTDVEVDRYGQPWKSDIGSTRVAQPTADGWFPGAARWMSSHLRSRQLPPRHPSGGPSSRQPPDKAKMHYHREESTDRTYHDGDADGHGTRTGHLQEGSAATPRHQARREDRAGVAARRQGRAQGRPTLRIDGLVRRGAGRSQQEGSHHRRSRNGHAPGPAGK